MVKRNLIIIFIIFFSTALNLAAEPVNSYFEKAVFNSQIEDSIKILKEGKEKGELEPSDYILLYYLLKAQGEREEAIYNALEGLKNSKDQKTATIFADIILSEFTYNSFTEEIAFEILKNDKDNISDPILKIAICNMLYIEFSRKGDRPSAEKILDNAGIPQGFFYSIVADENARLEFLGTDMSKINHSGMKYCERDGFLLHIPSTMLNTTSDFLALKTIPIEAIEDDEVNMVVMTNSPVKIFLDGKLAFYKNAFEKNLPPKDVINFKVNKGFHIVDILYYSVNSGDGVTLAFCEKGKSLKYLKTIPSLDEKNRISQFSKRDLFVKPAADSISDLALFALYESAVGNLSSSRMDLEKIIKENPESVPLKIAYTNMIIEKSYDLPQQYAVSKAESAVDSILQSNPNCPEALFYNTLFKSSSSEKEEILNDLRALTEKYQNDPRWFIQLAQELEAVEFFSEAKEILLRAEELFPGNASVEEEIYNFFKNRGDFEKSLYCLDKISKRRKVYSEYEEYYSSRGDYFKAIDYLNKEKEIYGDFDYFYEKNMIFYFLKMGKYKEALEIAENLLDSNPDSEQFSALKAKILSKMGKNEEAWKILEAMKEKSPKYFDYDYAKWLSTGQLPF
ncbi:MAG: tetratricopeptide repeat protein, partial [Acidobacteria bacterium]|nr:tetratricopeptide repeat protein [Acidobacteriota bacterium]